MTLLLVLTSQNMAVARGMPHAAGKIEMCTGTGPVMISVDENGEPIGPPHICPDFAATLIVFVSEPPMNLARPLTHALVLRPVARITALSRQAPIASARGPPALF